jgi:hypothetical protein
VRCLRIALAVVALVSCGADSGNPSPSASTIAQPIAASVRVTADDERCARRTFDALIAAVNSSDEGRLSSLVGGSFQWLGVTSTRNFDVAGSYELKGAIEVLLAIGRSGETWTLKRLEVNGRGWHGGVDFGIEIRRAGPDLPRPYVEAAGKGVLDCPAERVMLFGLGYGRVPRSADQRS